MVLKNPVINNIKVEVLQIFIQSDKGFSCEISHPIQNALIGL